MINDTIEQFSYKSRKFRKPSLNCFLLTICVNIEHFKKQLTLNESQKIGIELIFMGIGKTVRGSRVDLQAGVFDYL